MTHRGVSGSIVDMSTNPTIHLQSLGTVKAKPAADLVPGDVTVWNFGHAYDVISVQEASPQFVKVTLQRTRVYGRTEHVVRRMKKSRLVGVTA